MALFRYTWRTLVREIVLILAGIIFAVPLYLLIVVSLKPSTEAFLRPLSIPHSPSLRSYPDAWREAQLGQALESSVVITFFSVVCLIIIGSLAGYVIARRAGKASTLLYFSFVLGIILPIQLAVVPLYVAMRHLHLTSTYLGMIILYTGLLTPLTVFLYTGFIRALPRDYEEAALVDGARFLRRFVRVVFPLLYPITGTIAILTGLSIWNDLFIPLVFLSGSEHETLAVAMYSFVGDQSTDWNKTFAAVIISIMPILVFYLFAQKHLIRGFSGGIRG